VRKYVIVGSTPWVVRYKRSFLLKYRLRLHRCGVERSTLYRRRMGGVFFLFLFFLFPKVVFSQSQGQGWERGTGGVVGHRGIRGQEGYTRDRSISREGW